MTITAITPKNQKLVNRAVKALEKYNKANATRDYVDGMGGSTEKIDSKCEALFAKYEDITSELPKREVKKIETSDIYLLG